MSGKQSLRNELIEEIMEAVSIQDNFSADVEKIINDIDLNEQLDHENDKIRNDAMRFFLNALEAYNAKDYEGMQKFTHAGVQKLHEQAEVDFKDDKPRVNLRIKLSELSFKTIENKKQLTRLIASMRGGKKR
ncbi:MAG: hypothetical protein HY761_09870 [Candidatus Omnitrophica bacterium]|nr:hypothetical protein [Candidatus Omnitrophota bacterium]